MLFYGIFVIIVLIFVFLMYRKISFFNFKQSVKKEIPKKNIAIITLETRNMEMNKYHNQSFEKYAKIHGYDYIFFDNYKSELPIYWQKIQIMLDFLKNHNYDYVIWADSDVIIKDYNVPIESILNDKDIYIGKHSSIQDTVLSPIETVLGHDIKGINAGVFIIKNSNIGISFLEDCLNYYFNNENCYTDGKLTLNGGWSGECYEQYAMNLLIQDKYNKYFYEIPSYFLQNQDHKQNIGSDCVILHLYGTNKNITAQHFKNMI